MGIRRFPLADARRRSAVSPFTFRTIPGCTRHGSSLHILVKNGISLLAASLLFSGLGATGGWACQYCEMAADPSQQVVFPTADPSPAPVAGAVTGGTPSAVQPPSLLTPALTAASHVTTRLGDLPAAASRVAKLAALRLPTTALPASPRPAVQPMAAKSSVSAPTDHHPPAVRWADLGLLGVAATGGVFCWRTRRLG